MITETIYGLMRGENLDRERATETMRYIMGGEATDVQIAGLLIALKMKGETPEELAGFAEAMRSLAARIEPVSTPLVDTCGTGGDGKGTFNISTAAALVAAGAGAFIAKHGNRAVSSSCGSADVLEALGVSVDLGPDGVKRCIDEVGIGFLFAPQFHLAMRNVMNARRQLGVPTIFNYLGPLTNPAGAKRHVLGVNDRYLVPLFAEVLSGLGIERAFVVHGSDGMDEITTSGETFVAEVRGDGVVEYELNALDLGIPRADIGELKGSTPAENAALVMGVLEGKKGPPLDICLVNAAPAIVAAGLADSLGEGLEVARRAIESGAAGEKLEKLIDFTREEGGRDVPG